jgi:hypothetical protein
LVTIIHISIIIFRPLLFLLFTRYIGGVNTIDDAIDLIIISTLAISSAVRLTCSSSETIFVEKRCYNATIKPLI